MPVSVVKDDYNPVANYLTPETPSEIRRQILASYSNANRVKSVQCILEDEHGGKVSLLVDNMSVISTLVVEGGSSLLTLHDAERMLEFWKTVIEGMKK